MSDFERTDIYKGNTEFLDNLEREALSDQVPIIRRSMQRFFKLMLKMTRPKNILEVGTAVGFSAILMARARKLVIMMRLSGFRLVYSKLMAILRSRHSISTSKSSRSMLRKILSSLTEQR